MKTQAQLGFCKGNSGDPIFEETFGSGTTYGRLPKGCKTGYKYKKGRPGDGFYTIVSTTFGWFNWFNIGDHTNDAKGRMLLVNAASNPGEFFEISISDLCENTSYEFSSWLINVFPYYHGSCGGNGKSKPINVTFEIWDSTDSILLKSGDTGDIYASVNPNWKQYGLVFQTKPGQTSVILKMRNNGRGGCGNDLAIDDIMFRTCGDAVVVKDSVRKKENAVVYVDELPYSATLTATPDFSVFSTHFYQWQESKDGVNWINIAGENKNKIVVKDINSVIYYRTLIAEDVINVLNSSCNSTSEIFKVSIKHVVNPNKKIKPRKKVKSVHKLVTKSISETGNIIIEKLSEPPKKKRISLSGNLIKTQKKVIVVMDGVKTIYHKVWIDGVKGKFVQTGEEIVKQGDVDGGFIIEVVTYVKTRYGYNSITKIYTF